MSTIGVLQCLTMPQSNIAYSVHSVFQFMYASRTTHVLATKRIFRKLQCTLDHGLLFRPYVDASVIIAYSYANWASCKDTCCLTTSHAVYFGLNLIV